MTDNTPAGEQNTPTSGQETQTNPQSAETQNQAADSKNAEAAKYRTQLREAEAERDTLRQQITAMRTAEIERLAGQHIAKPDALWRTGTTIDELLTEDGTIDAAAVEA